MNSNNSRKSMPVKMLRISIAAVYIWFGALKFVPELSPADQIAKQTIRCFTLGMMPDHIAILLLAIIECMLGLLLVFNKWMKFATTGVLAHLVLTFSPFLLFPGETFQNAPYGFTLLGQYIFKNIILISAAYIIWDSERRSGKGVGNSCVTPETGQLSFSKKNSKKVILH